MPRDERVRVRVPHHHPVLPPDLPIPLCALSICADWSLKPARRRTMVRTTVSYCARVTFLLFSSPLQPSRNAQLLLILLPLCGHILVCHDITQEACNQSPKSKFRHCVQNMYSLVEGAALGDLQRVVSVTKNEGAGGDEPTRGGKKNRIEKLAKNQPNSRFNSGRTRPGVERKYAPLRKTTESQEYSVWSEE